MITVREFTSNLDPSFQKMEMSLLGDMDMNSFDLRKQRKSKKSLHYQVHWLRSHGNSVHAPHLCCPCSSLGLPGLLTDLWEEKSPSPCPVLDFLHFQTHLEMQESPECKAKTWTAVASTTRPAAYLTQALAFPTVLPQLKEKSKTCLDFVKEKWRSLPTGDKNSHSIQHEQTLHQQL